MTIHQVSRAEYLATFAEPMRRLGKDETYRPVPLKEYVSECIDSLNLPTTTTDVEIHHVYLSGDKKHSHVLFYLGARNRYLVVILAHGPDVILGHHLLDLDHEYGIVAEQSDGSPHTHE